ncbi:unnamed protein product [Cochlearia groenlandica]
MPYTSTTAHRLYSFLHIRSVNHLFCLAQRKQKLVAQQETWPSDNYLNSNSEDRISDEMIGNHETASQVIKDGGRSKFDLSQTLFYASFATLMAL